MPIRELFYKAIFSIFLRLGFLKSLFEGVVHFDVCDGSADSKIQKKYRYILNKDYIFRLSDLRDCRVFIFRIGWPTDNNTDWRYHA